MTRQDALTFALWLIPTAVVTALIALGAERLLRRAGLRVQLLAVALLAAMVSALTLGILGSVMVVQLDNVAETIALVAASTAAGVAVALILGRRTRRALDRLAGTLTELGDGNLDVRAGRLGAGEDLDRLARAVDRMTERLAGALAAERLAEDARRDLFAAVSHDLRAPLGALRAIAEAVDEEVVTDARTLERYASDLRRSVDVLVELVDNLFELAQLEAGEVVADRDGANVAEVVASALRAARTQAIQRDVRLAVDLGATAGVSCSPRLARVLHNLLQNAIQHSPRGATVRVDGRLRGGLLVLAVRDAGDGIAAEHLERLFEPFYRADPARHDPGAGLGLALVERIVTNLGGRVGVVSAPGRGATFTVEVPLPAGAASAAAPPPGSARGLRAARVS